ncbi:Cupin domain protein [Sporobacter termitidis DSM 10068]|uniref:Cupin domain protein n=1 Tax=Sporobacter termitidis DSM 10068 TaxID=1123282 RepID=A0A1M5ZDB7_9FIRM|nr:cupin domain-containing protein [Sporobacter termitidis]SHI22161.1 Cupin domain protein [Sporobacter termitidis DSM 10068]
MNGHILKNIDFEKELELGALVDYQQGQVVSRTLVQNDAVSVTLFSFDQGEEISAHKSDGDAMVTVLEGTARITIGGTEHSVKAGQTIVMPAGISHAVAADGKFKMLLVVVFPQ